MSELVRMSALTYTKLNVQISVDEISDDDTVIQKFSEGKSDLLIVDSDRAQGNCAVLISSIRKAKGSSGKKILVIYSKPIDKDEIFEAGCDSIMEKREFRLAINNLLLC